MRIARGRWRSGKPRGARPIPATGRRPGGSPNEIDRTFPRGAWRRRRHERPRSLALSTLPRAARTASPDVAPPSRRANAPTKREAVAVTVTGARAPPPRALASRAALPHCRLARPWSGRPRPGGLAGHAARRSPSSRDGARSSQRDAAFDDGRRCFGCSVSSSSSSGGAPAPTPVARADRKEPTPPPSASRVLALPPRICPDACRQA